MSTVYYPETHQGKTGIYTKEGLFPPRRAWHNCTAANSSSKGFNSVVQPSSTPRCERVPRVPASAEIRPYQTYLLTRLSHSSIAPTSTSHVVLPPRRPSSSAPHPTRRPRSTPDGRHVGDGGRDPSEMSSLWTCFFGHTSFLGELTSLES